jgi:hypothetical protein
MMSAVKQGDTHLITPLDCYIGIFDRVCRVMLWLIVFWIVPCCILPMDSDTLGMTIVIPIACAHGWVVNG